MDSSPQKNISPTDVSKRIKDNIGSKGLKIKRVFTKGKENWYDGIEFEFRSSKIVNPDGSVVFEMKNVEVPVSWSQMATDILAQKYCRKKGVPQRNSKGELRKDKEGNVILGGENSIKQVATRLAGAWRHWGEEYGYFNSKEDADAFQDELAYMITMQIGAPNSPQWFNTGLNYAYGLTGAPQGHYYVDELTGETKLSEDAYTRSQLHACFIQSVEDDLVNEGGIFDLVLKEARLFKYGSGTGTNFSPIRGKGELLSGGGTSSGLMSFLKVFDSAAGAIKSGGTTRRAAKMVCVDMDHPEIEEFINWKVVEEQKVAALVSGSHVNYLHLKKIMQSAEQKGINPETNKELKKLIKEAHDNFVPLNFIKQALMLVENGVSSEEFTLEKYDTDFRSEAYSTVSGQNSNNSVRITNEFLEAVQQDKEWKLRNRTDGGVYKTVKARDLWEQIIRAAWQSADPGVQFDTTINEWHTCPADGKINASNPCSEYMFLDNTACNLASLNLVKFYDDKTGKFDVETYKHAIRLWTIVLEISVLMSHLPGKEIAELTYKYRTLGLGYANIGSLLMRQGIPYDSEEGFAITGSLTAILTGESYATSAELAKVRGSFERFEANKEHMMRVIRNHRRAAYNANENEYEGLTIKPMGINPKFAPKYLLEEARKAWDFALDLGEKYGYRNAQVSVIAPTGTIGLVMDCDTTGIEPDFALVKFKKLVGGGYFKIVNQSVEPALQKLGYSKKQIDEIIKYIIGHATLQNAPFINHEVLKSKGFTDKEIMAVEGGLKNAFEIRHAFNKWILGEEFCKDVLGLSDEELNNSNLDILKAIGFSDEEISAASEYACGTMTIEGAPHIKPEHLKVFDCANKCGTKGERYIATLGHLKQMAAAQPFISGAISKTVNLPEDATLEDVEQAYWEGWRLMLKANALYRDGSKLSQPLNSSSDKSSYAELFNFNDEEVVSEDVDSKAVQTIVMKEQSTVKRKRLPDERHSITHKFTVGAIEGYITVGLFEDGTPGEIFLVISKAGSTLSGIMDAFATSLSLNLQYGVPLEVLVEKFTNSKFEPSGMTSNKEIPIAKSLIDYIARWLALKFLDKETAKYYHNEELVEKSYREGSNFRIRIPHINGKGHTEVLNFDNENDEDNMQSFKPIVTDPVQMKLEQQISFDGTLDEDTLLKEAKSKGYTGEICGTCGSVNVRKNGSCSVCEDCGSTTGCS
ncbi:MAG: transcriptional regulator [Candidatus Dojkabacteria bacterium]|nr:MAG: transcriptional regulator [Candidatus Dojkabacteria bacterium]